LAIFDQQNNFVRYALSLRLFSRHSEALFLWRWNLSFFPLARIKRSVLTIQYLMLIRPLIFEFSVFKLLHFLFVVNHREAHRLVHRFGQVENILFFLVFWNGLQWDWCRIWNCVYD
jgi:hypothetical protein